MFLFAGLLTLTGRSSSAAPTPFPSPLIVAKGKVLNQTAPATATIFTPTQSGLYRLSVYPMIVRTDSTSQSYWCYSPSWSDDSGFWEASQILCGYPSLRGPFQYVNNFYIGGTALVMEVKAGSSITYTVSQVGPSDNSAYSLYYTLERLE